MKNRIPLTVSAVIVAAMCIAGVWAWLKIPAGTQIPIHWNIHGQPNGYAAAPLALFMAPAMTALVVALFAAIPLLEPRRLNLEHSAKFYHAAWIATILLLATVHGLALYSAMHANMAMGNVVVGAVSLLAIVIGNYLGKTRSMFLGGVRTPWTLSSEYSWQQTHSLAGKLFIATGLLGFVAAIVLPVKAAFEVLIWAIVATAAISVAMSYVYWLRDPERGAFNGTQHE